MNVPWRSIAKWVGGVSLSSGLMTFVAMSLLKSSPLMIEGGVPREAGIVGWSAVLFLYHIGSILLGAGLGAAMSAIGRKIMRGRPANDLRDATVRRALQLAPVVLAALGGLVALGPIIVGELFRR